jgi:hypothetical protein
MCKEFKIKILWGLDHEPDDMPVTYSFKTQAELDAFEEGIDVACGWLDYEVIYDE